MRMFYYGANIVCVCVWCVCARVCNIIPFVLDIRFVDVPAGVTQEGGNTVFFHLLSAVFALIFLARRIEPSLSLVDREVELCLLTIQSFSTRWAFIISFIYFLVRKNPSSCDDIEIRTFVPTSEGLEVVAS